MDPLHSTPIDGFIRRKTASQQSDAAQKSGNVQWRSVSSRTTERAEYSRFQNGMDDGTSINYDEYLSSIFSPSDSENHRRSIGARKSVYAERPRNHGGSTLEATVKSETPVRSQKQVLLQMIDLTEEQSATNVSNEGECSSTTFTLRRQTLGETSIQGQNQRQSEKNAVVESSKSVKRHQEPSRSINADEFERMIANSAYFRKLSENQAQLIQKQDNLERAMHGILEELRLIRSSGRPFNAENIQPEPGQSLESSGGNGQSLQKRKRRLSPKAIECRREARNSSVHGELDRSKRAKIIPNSQQNPQITRAIEPSPSNRPNESRSIGEHDVASTQNDLVIRKNTLKSMYFNNPSTKTCVFCNKRYEKIVAHYKTSHSAAEVFASRLSPSMAEEILRKRPDSSVQKKGHQRLMKAQCHFCETDKTFTLNYWLTHIRSHTGEYSNQCRECGGMFAYPSVHCRGKTTRIDEPHLSEHNLEAYLCLECNYIQINEANMEQHLKNQHQFGNEVLTAKYQTITLLTTQPNQSVDQSILKKLNTLKRASGQGTSFIEGKSFLVY